MQLGQMIRIVTLVTLLSSLWTSGAWAAAPFFVSGDGVIHLRAGRGVARVAYRRSDGTYDPSALQQLDRLFGVRGGTSLRMELRLIEVLDHIQDHFGSRPLVLISGYRNRQYNAGLRRQGKLAAQSSMHIEGGAADFHLQGVESAQVAAFARGLQCCGVGYYHGREVHIDTGPVRFWDEQTSGTEDTTPQRNAKIMLSTDRDVYALGQTVGLRLMRITELPVGVARQATLEEYRKGEWRAVQAVALGQKDCMRLADFDAARRLSLRVTHSSTAPQRVRMAFCEQISDQMPPQIVSNPFVVR